MLKMKASPNSGAVQRGSLDLEQGHDADQHAGTGGRNATLAVVGIRSADVVFGRSGRRLGDARGEQAGAAGPGRNAGRCGGFRR